MKTRNNISPERTAELKRSDKSLIDIEKLLQWAYANELSKKSRGRFRSDITSNFRTDERVSTSTRLSYVPCHLLADGTPHDDAVTVDRAIDDKIKDLSDCWFNDMLDAETLFGDYRKIAAEAIDAIMSASIDGAALLRLHAHRKTRPPWREDRHPISSPPEYRDIEFGHASGTRVIGVSGNLEVGIDPSGDFIDMISPNRTDDDYDLRRFPRSVIEWNGPSLVEIGQMRAEYLAWHASLVLLTDHFLSDPELLKEHTPTKPAAEKMPWMISLNERSRGDTNSQTTVSKLPPKGTQLRAACDYLLANKGRVVEIPFPRAMIEKIQNRTQFEILRIRDQPFMVQLLGEWRLNGTFIDYRGT